VSTLYLSHPPIHHIENEITHVVHPSPDLSLEDDPDTYSRMRLHKKDNKVSNKLRK
jgi:hypothetical protein